MPSPGDCRSMDHQAQDAMVGEYCPNFGASPEDEGVRFNERKDKYTSEMVVAVQDVDVMVPEQVFKQPVDVRNEHVAQEVGQQGDRS